MTGPLKVVGLVVLGLVLVVCLGGVAVFLLSENKLAARTSVPSQSVNVPSDTASIQHGQHLAGAIAMCTQCHGPNLAGAVIEDDRSARIVAPNLTGGGVGGSLSDADLARAIRGGVDPSGRPLWVMPSNNYSQLSDADLGALIAYLRSLPPISTTLPTSEIRPLGRLRLATAQLPLAPAPSPAAAQAPPAVDATRAYGQYLVTIAGCARCHGPALAGGNWSEADFVRAMRTGRRPDGSQLDDAMPWQYYAQMSDLELKAIWEYLGVVPARTAG